MELQPALAVLSCIISMQQLLLEAESRADEPITAGDLVQNILMRCSPMDEIRVAATCQTLWKAQQEYYKHLTEHSVTVDGSTGGNISLCPANVKKLTLKLASSPTYDTDSILKELQSCIEQARQDGSLTCSTVQELQVNEEWYFESNFNSALLQLVQQLLQVIPNLKTLSFKTFFMPELVLALKQLDAYPTLFRLSVSVVHNHSCLLHLIAAVMPNLDTLCLDCASSADASWLQPLSQLPNLQYLSLDVGSDSLPNMYQIKSLRHLKLSHVWVITPDGLLSLRGLQQLVSLSLSNMTVKCCEALAPLAELNVSSLTLDSVKLHHEVTEAQTVQQPQGPCWPKLTKVNLSGVVSEVVLQHMALPHPAAGSLKVQVAKGTFDQFAIDCNQSMQGCQILYQDDTTPILGPLFLAAAGVTSLDVHGQFAFASLQKMYDAKVPLQELCISAPYACHSIHYMVFPTLQKLTLFLRMELSINSWYTLFSKCPLLTDMVFWVEPEPSIMANIRAAANQLGISINKQVANERLHYQLTRS